MEEHLKPRVVDARRANWFSVDNVIFDEYGAEIGPYGLAVYCMLARYADKGGKSFPGIKKMSEKLGMSERKVQSCLRELETFSLLKIEPKRRPDGGHASNDYILLDVQGASAHHAEGGAHHADDPPHEVRINKKTKKEEDPVKNPTGSDDSSESHAGGQKTEQQHLVERLNGALRETHNVRLTKEQYGYHVGKFRDILAGDDPSPDELDRVISHMISVYPKFPKMDARLALQDVRLGRDTGEAWDGPQPWERNGEPINPHSTEGQKLRDKKWQLDWYLNAYDGIKEEKVKGTWEACSSHTDILNILERRK